MKIAFLNGSLETGRDGVGDYTRSLAQECVRKGHECGLIALNDRWLTEPERADENGIVIMRLPAALDWTERIRLAKEALDAFQPDWFSLQFVPYSFHPKGIVHGLAAKLRSLTESAKLHIMFHELWIGDHIGASAKDRLVGEIQKRVILRMIRLLRPDAVHTSNAAYVARLQRYGVKAGLLPLFGNVPIGEANGDDWLFPKLNAAGLHITTAARDKFWLFGFFGALHPVWPPEPLFSQIETEAVRQKRKVAILSIGRIGAGEALWERMAAENAARFVFLKLGEQPAETVSQYLRSLDFGLAASPYSLIGKSGTAVAMLEHGLPVIVNREDAVFPFYNEAGAECEPGIIRLDSNFQERLRQNNSRRIPTSRLPDIAGRWLDSLAVWSNFPASAIQEAKSVIKRFGKKMLRVIAPSWFLSISAARAERQSQKVLQFYGLPEITAALIARCGAKVLSGPFTGLQYITVSAGSALAPKLIGSYECELHDIIERSLENCYDTIIDVGSAEGYYVAGFAMRLQNAPRIYAFDASAVAQAKCRRLLQQNALENKVIIEGFCDAERLQRIAVGRSLVICDCEGYEIELLQPDIAPCLNAADIIVELHDHSNPDITPTLLKRFDATHDIRIIETAERRPSDYEDIQFLSLDQQRLALSEFRPCSQQWAYMTSKLSPQRQSDSVLQCR